MRSPPYSTRAVLLTAVSLAALLTAGCGGSSADKNWKQKYRRAATRAQKAQSRASSLEKEKEELSGDLSSVRKKLRACKEKQVELKEELSSTQSRVGDRLQAAHKKLQNLRKQLKEEEKKTAAAREKARRARRELQELQDKLTGTAKELSRVGNTLFEAGTYEPARVLLEGAVELGSKDPKDMFALGYCLARKSRYEAAASRYKKAINRLRKQDDPDGLLLAKALNNCGAALEETGKPEKARTFYEKALSARDQFPPAHFNLGQLYREKLSNPGDAVKHLRRHIALGGSRSASARKAIRDLQSGQNKTTSAEGRTDRK